jgi:hypothetical protein
MLRNLNRIQQSTKVLNFTLFQQKNFQHANKAAAAIDNMQQIVNQPEPVVKASMPDQTQTLKNIVEAVKKSEKKSFAKMFKESKFVALGDMENKYLIGKIVEVLGDDLYIDYGGKFHCVCKRPNRRPE